MKKSSLQKLLAIVLVGAMVVATLTGCGKKKNSGAMGITPGFEKFSEQVTLQIPVYDRGVEGVPDVTNNYWTKWVQENFGDKYNIKVEFVPIPRSDVLTQYAMLASTQKLPTVLMEYDYPKLAQWADDGYLAEFSLDEFKGVAPTYYQKMVDNGQIKYTELNDKTFFTLAERPYFNTNYTYISWVRMDWLKQVGYDHIPATKDEYNDAMTKIMKAGIAAHPGGGQMVLTGQGADQNYAYRAYPTNEEEWAIYGDYNIPSLGWEPNYQLLKIENEKYNLGILDPEYYLIDTETAKANFINGKTYEWSGYISGTMDWLEAFYKQNPKGELAVKVQSLEADKANDSYPALRSNNPFGMMVAFSSQATPNEVKAAWMYMEWMLTEALDTMQYGIEGKNYNYENGEKVAVAYGDQPIDYKQGYNNNKDYWCIAIEAITDDTIEKTIAKQSPKGLPMDFTQDITTNYYNQVKAWEKGWVTTDCMFAKSVDAVTEYQAPLQSLYVSLRDQLVQCKPEEFDALYEKLTKQYNEAGYQAILDERKELYKSGYTSKLK